MRVEMINFSDLGVAPLANTLGRTLETIYRPATGRVIPSETQVTSILPEEGVGVEALPGLWQEIVERSTRLAEPTMLGHMEPGTAAAGEDDRKAVVSPDAGMIDRADTASHKRRSSCKT